MSTAAADVETARRLVAGLPDPEIPVITIDDLGILRDVTDDDGRIVVTITPTYSGCPAMQLIEEQILETLSSAGFQGEVRTVYSPAWTTDWMSSDGRAALRDFGIAPPRPIETAVALTRPASTQPVSTRPVSCPHCGSSTTEIVSEFGSTACKALHRCLDCREPFDHFKEL